MRAGGGNSQADALGRRRQFASSSEDLPRELGDVATDARADFDDGLVQLVLELIAERRRRRFDQLARHRAKLTRDWIDDLKLFFDADGESHVTPSSPTCPCPVGPRASV